MVDDIIVPRNTKERQDLSHFCLGLTDQLLKVHRQTLLRPLAEAVPPHLLYDLVPEHGRREITLVIDPAYGDVTRDY